MPAISAKSIERLGVERLAQDRVMRPAGGQPGLDRRAEIRPRSPHRAGHRKPRQRLLGRHDVDDVGHDPEPVRPCR